MSQYEFCVADKPTHVQCFFYDEISVCEWPESSCGMHKIRKISFLQILKQK
jgi:hypothetical protein